MLAPGTYQENLSANGKEFGLSSEYLVSCDTMDIYNTVIDGNGGTGLTIDLEEHIKVIGLTVTNCNSGIYFNGQNLNWHYDLYFSNLRLINNSSHGINGYLWRTGNYLLNSHVANNGSHGVRSVNKGAFYMGECLIENNGGHGIYNNQSGFMAAACIIRNNSGDGIYSTYWGAAFISYRCIIHSNSGDGIHSKNSGAQRVYNCTVVNNGEYGLRGTVNSKNSIIYGNTAGVHLVDNGGDPGSQQSSSFAHTISELLLPGTGNQQDDPELDSNFTLLPTSPALLAGNPESIAIGSYEPNNSSGYGSYNTGAGMSLGAIQVTDIIEGCTDVTACNFNNEANLDSGSCIPSGCTEEDACNFFADAGCDDGSCDYSCCPGPGCCGDGTTWDTNSATCIVTNATDADLDGCTGVSDILEVLLNFGLCTSSNDTLAETSWACGDPVNYWDYDYATVLIGDQCWFAENLRTERFNNGDSILYITENDEWAAMTTPGMCWYQHDPAGQAQLTGGLYNWYSVNDTRQLCPSGWHVSTDEDWMALELSSGMDSSEIATTGFRGTASQSGVVLKASSNWCCSSNGTDSLGFNGQAGGWRNGAGGFGAATSNGIWWTSDDLGWWPMRRDLAASNDGVQRCQCSGSHDGFSVRCIKE